jgi:hypothetical protein
MLSFLRKSGVIHDPGDHRPALLHGGQHTLAHLLQHDFVTPRCFRHQMMQGLTGPLGVMGIQPSCHWLDALALPGQQQTLAIVLQRRVPVFMPRGARQAVDIYREASLLWAWRGEV